MEEAFGDFAGGVGVEDGGYDESEDVADDGDGNAGEDEYDTLPAWAVYHEGDDGGDDNEGCEHAEAAACFGDTDAGVLSEDEDISFAGDVHGDDVEYEDGAGGGGLLEWAGDEVVDASREGDHEEEEEADPAQLPEDLPSEEEEDESDDGDDECVAFSGLVEECVSEESDELGGEDDGNSGPGGLDAYSAESGSVEPDDVDCEQGDEGADGVVGVVAPVLHESDNGMPIGPYQGCE